MKLRFKLWHLFAIVALVAAMIWAWMNVSIHLAHFANKGPASGTSIAVGFGDHWITLYDSFLSDQEIQDLLKTSPPNNNSN